jgi:glycosyltransferase involved in cell wall biosynthesis
VDEPPARRDKKFRIVHSGYLHTEMGMDLRQKRFVHRFLGGAADGIDILTRSHFFLIKAIERWVEEDPSAAHEIELVFVGATTPGDERITKDGRLREVIRFTGYLPHDKSVEMVRTAELLFLPMHNLPPGRRSTIVPGKTYEYMATGKPILAAVPDGDAKEFLGKYGNASFCRPDDHEAMLDVLKRVYWEWKTAKECTGQNQEYVFGFERRLLTSQLAKVFNSVLWKMT